MASLKIKTPDGGDVVVSTWGNTSGTWGTGTFGFGPYIQTEKSIVVTENGTKRFTEYFEIFHNADCDRDLTQSIIDAAISKLRLKKFNPNKIITNHDTLMTFQQHLETILGNIKIGDKERSEQILLFTFWAADVENGILKKYRGLDIIIDDVPVDTISRIYICENDRAGIEIRDLK